MTQVSKITSAPRHSTPPSYIPPRSQHAGGVGGEKSRGWGVRGGGNLSTVNNKRGGMGLVGQTIIIGG